MSNSSAASLHHLLRDFNQRLEALARHALRLIPSAMRRSAFTKGSRSLASPLPFPQEELDGLHTLTTKQRVELGNFLLMLRWLPPRRGTVTREKDSAQTKFAFSAFRFAAEEKATWDQMVRVVQHFSAVISSIRRRSDWSSSSLLCEAENKYRKWQSQNLAAIRRGLALNKQRVTLLPPPWFEVLAMCMKEACWVFQQYWLPTCEAEFLVALPEEDTYFRCGVLFLALLLQPVRHCFIFLS